MTVSRNIKHLNNERLRALCKDGTRQSAVAKRNASRAKFNGIGIALKNKLAELKP